MKRKDYSNLPVFEMPGIQGHWDAIWIGLGKIMPMAALAFGIGYIKMK